MNTAALTPQQVAAAVRHGGTASAELVNRYYGLCIPFYREFLGDHWHTGFYEHGGETGPADQLRMETIVADSAGIDASCAVLDVGCGVGGTACHLARRTGARVRGLTPNAEQLEIARASAERQGLAGRVRFDLGEAETLPYADGSFDVVTFFESPCHFPDRARFFREAWRVLRPGGRIAGEDWLVADAAPEAERALWGERIARTWAIPRLGTLRSYARDIVQAGFRVEVASDLREEMALLRGFVTEPTARAEVRLEMQHTADPIRRLVIEGVLVLGEAAACGAFTVGRFLARKPMPA